MFRVLPCGTESGLERVLRTVHFLFYDREVFTTNFLHLAAACRPK